MTNCYATVIKAIKVLQWKTVRSLSCESNLSKTERNRPNRWHVKVEEGCRDRWLFTAPHPIHHRDKGNQPRECVRPASSFHTDLQINKKPFVQRSYAKLINCCSFITLTVTFIARTKKIQWISSGDLHNSPILIWWYSISAVKLHF